MIIKKEINDLHNFDAERVIVKFTAEWCGPCKLIAPFYEKLSNQPKYKNTVKFLELNIDDDVTKRIIQTMDYTITSVPTFIAIKYGKFAGSMTGINQAELVNLVDKMFV